jgi:DNA-binding NtrC family response regulator
LAAGRQVTSADLEPWLLDHVQGPAVQADRAEGATDGAAVGMRLEDMERRLIEATLDHYAGHRAKAAQALGIGIRTLTNKLRQYGYAPRTRTFGKAA